MVADAQDSQSQRLNKVLARAGVASRRAADRMIASGRVSVNGREVVDLGTKVDPQTDVVRVDGKRIPAPPKTPAYFMLHKPVGYVTTLADPEGRPTIVELMPGGRRRLFPVGRLDFNSEGLLVLTDDGELTRDLMHPSRGVPKSYRVKIQGQPSQEALNRLRRGIELDGRLTRPATVVPLRRGHNSWIEITIHEGRKHQIRRMCEAVGHPVMRLRRTGYGGVDLGKLGVGEVRRLTESEVQSLRAATAGKAGPARGRSKLHRRR